MSVVYQIKHFIPMQDGRTPLVLASSNSRNEIINLLLEHGAKIDFPNTVCSIANSTYIDYVPYSGKFSRGPIFMVNWQSVKIKPAK